MKFRYCENLSVKVTVRLTVLLVQYEINLCHSIVTVTVLVKFIKKNKEKNVVLGSGLE